MWLSTILEGTFLLPSLVVDTRLLNCLKTHSVNIWSNVLLYIIMKHHSSELKVGVILCVTVVNSVMHADVVIEAAGCTHRRLY